MEALNLAHLLGKFDDHWSPRAIADVNDYEVKLVKVAGEFVWHTHDDTDELFLVLSGRLTIQLRDQDVTLGPGELFVVPRVSSTARGQTTRPPPCCSSPRAS